MELEFTWMFVFKALVLGFVFMGVTIFVLKKVLFDSTQGAVNRLNRETEEVRNKQKELNEKIKQANEELTKRRSEADALIAKMRADAEEKAKQEREKIIKKARADGEEIISRAQRTKEDMRKVLEKDAELKVVDFTVILLEEILKDRTRGAFNVSLIEEFYEDLHDVDVSMITEDIRTAEVTISEPLTDKLRNQLSALLKERLNRSVELDIKIDPSIISGMILKFGSLTLNGSLKYMLDEKGVEVKDKLDKGLM